MFNKYYYYYYYNSNISFCLHPKEFQILKLERSIKTLQKGEIKMSIDETMYVFP